MAGTNDFKAFATDANANVTSQEEWETLTALKKGFSSGKASSAQVSKALRQPSTMAAVLGQFIANAELDALDDGDVDGLVAKLATAITTNLGLGEAAKRNVGTGGNQIPDMNNFTSSLTSPGWQKLPSGLIIQWGTANPSSTGEVFITFPVAFSAYPMYVGFGPQQISLPNVVQSPVISAPTITNLGCGVRNLMIPTAGGVPVASMSSFFWIAVGK
ncbi:TPA: hypothetical protein J6N42_003829 [Escherichia coli]|nr:hypothetical protein [Escherichia coli]